MKFSRILAGALVLGSVVAASGSISSAQAEGQWQRNHPWRSADNARLHQQNRRITQGVRDGQLTHGEARAIRSDDRAIRAEERADSAVNGTHLTYRDQRMINAQENANSRAIFQGRHP